VLAVKVLGLNWISRIQLVLRLKVDNEIRIIKLSDLSSGPDFSGLSSSCRSRLWRSWNATGSFFTHTCSCICFAKAIFSPHSKKNILIVYRRMSFSGMLHCVALVRTDISEERNVSIIRVSTIGVLITAKGVPSSPSFGTLMMEAIRSYETSVHTSVTRRNIPEDGILHSHRRNNFRSYLKRILLQFSNINNALFTRNSIYLYWNFQITDNSAYIFFCLVFSSPTFAISALIFSSQLLWLCMHFC
jgi:hypothetical protein